MAGVCITETPMQQKMVFVAIDEKVMNDALASDGGIKS
jgi:hypothetical protein